MSPELFATFTKASAPNPPQIRPKSASITHPNAQVGQVHHFVSKSVELRLKSVRLVKLVIKAVKSVEFKFNLVGLVKVVEFTLKSVKLITW